MKKIIFQLNVKFYTYLIYDPFQIKVKKIKSIRKVFFFANFDSFKNSLWKIVH